MLLFRIFVDQLREPGIPLPDDPLPSHDEAGVMQHAALAIIDSLRRDADAPLPEIDGEGAGRA